MKYDIHFRPGTMITVESRRTLDEISDFFSEIINSDTPVRVWGVLADGDEPTALVSIIDVMAIVPHADATSTSPARVRDRQGDIWEEVSPGRWALPAAGVIEDFSYIERNYGPVEVLTSRGSSA